MHISCINLDLKRLCSISGPLSSTKHAQFWLLRCCLKSFCARMRRDRKQYSQQADYAGFDAGAGLDQAEVLTAGEGESLNIRSASCLQHCHGRISQGGDAQGSLLSNAQLA